MDVNCQKNKKNLKNIFLLEKWIQVDYLTQNK